ncbi:hypothetical protein KEF85_08285 [Methylomonas paludis]|uniref:Translational machinery protein n=1 Tax=Methylomonas paludis TaxID=1173101 RepID=A0A975MR20_9GAMM|nr:hypothetical protein [Methylomonas paludis]QWF72427.1 hypothetical protein KEF85_08285 [Methylomonas paludis]
MNTKAGIWIDHRQAYIVLIGPGSESLKNIESDIEKHVRFSSHTADIDGAADDQRDHRYTSHLNAYYDKVIALLGDASVVLVFGPGEAKRELEQRLISKGGAKRIIGIETADKMTESQITTKVRQHYDVLFHSV